MNKFNWDLIDKPNTVVHCETEEQAIELLTEAHDNRFKWRNGIDYLSGLNYDVCESNTCYYIHYGVYCNVEYSKERGLEILKFEECKLMNKLLDVDFIIQKDNKTIVLDIKHMDESLRSPNGSITLAETCDDKYKILSSLCPEINSTFLVLKGRNRNRDNEFTYFTFDSTEEMNEYIKNINKLINKINNPVIEIDINKNSKYEFGDNISVSIYKSSNYISMKFCKYHKGIKTFYIDDKEEDGQPFDEVVEEFDNFCKRRNINAKLVR